MIVRALIPVTVTVIVNVSDELKSVSASDIKFSIVFSNGKIRMIDGSSSTISFTPSGYGLVNTVGIKEFHDDNFEWRVIDSG